MSTIVRTLSVALVVLFSLAMQSQTFTVLYTFSGGADGAYPHGALVRDASGNLYGVTVNGGNSGNGAVFKLDSGGVESVLHSFAGSPDGQYPSSGLVHDGHALYGITENGGTATVGAAYGVTAQGKERVIHSFGATGSDGVFPVSDLTRDAAGNLYGTAQAGGSFGGGIIYKLTPAGAQTVLYAFRITGGDGSAPVGGVVLDSSGNIYGTTDVGGAFGKGTVFKLDTRGHETLLYSFGAAPNDGANPQSDLVRDSSGNLYGTTNVGGTANLGTVFKLDTGGAETILHNFTGGSDGANPSAGLTRDAFNNLFGDTTFGGSAGFGVVFEVDSSGVETVLHAFTGQSDGGNPQGNLIQDSTGTLYGGAGGGSTGGGAQYGTIFKLVP